MPNRLTAAIDKKHKDIQSRLAAGLVTQERLDALHKDLDLDLGDHATYQTLKSRAMLEGILTAEEAQTIYVILGETKDTFNRQPLAAKVVLSTVLAELLERSIRRRA